MVTVINVVIGEFSRKDLKWLAHLWLPDYGCPIAVSGLITTLKNRAVYAQVRVEEIVIIMIKPEIWKSK